MSETDLINFCRKMVKMAKTQFPDYKTQIECQLPPCFMDNEAEEAEDLDADDMWSRMKKMVNSFNGFFNSRERVIDRIQARDHQPSSIDQFLDDSKDKAAMKKKKAKENASKSGGSS
jgi:hypothetical protein